MYRISLYEKWHFLTTIWWCIRNDAFNRDEKSPVSQKKILMHVAWNVWHRITEQYFVILILKKYLRRVYLILLKHFQAMTSGVFNDKVLFRSQSISLWSSEICFSFFDSYQNPVAVFISHFMSLCFRFSLYFIGVVGLPDIRFQYILFVSSFSIII